MVSACSFIIEISPNGVYNENDGMEENTLQTVVETPELIRQSRAFANNAIIDEFISFIAKEPMKGSIIQGTGGIRKIRWQTDKHQGKSSGMRVLYYYHDQAVPIFLLTAYAKSQRANISLDYQVFDAVG